MIRYVDFFWSITTIQAITHHQSLFLAIPIPLIPVNPHQIPIEPPKKQQKTHEIPVLLHFLPLQCLPFFLRQLPVQLLPGLLAERSPVAQDLCSEVVLRRTSDIAPAVVLNQLQEGLNEVLQGGAP